MKRFLLVLLILVASAASAQVASVPYRMQWGETVNGGQVYANDKHIVERLERCFVDVVASGSYASSAQLLDVVIEVTDKGSNLDASGTFTAPFSGYYTLTANAWIATAAVNVPFALYASSPTALANFFTGTGGHAGGDRLSGSKVIKLTAGEYLKMYLNQGAGTTYASISWQIEGFPWQ